MQPYIFREEEQPKFNLTFSSGLAVLILLLLLGFVQKRHPFQVPPEEIARLQALKEQRQRDMVFRFSDAPDEDVEHEDPRFLSDANRRQRSQQREESPNEDPDPFSRGNTFELENGQPGQPGSVPQPPTPRVVQPEVQPSPDLKPQEQPREEQQAKTEEEPQEEATEEPVEEVAEATQEEPEEVTDQEVPDPVKEQLETSDRGTLPVVKGGPRPYRPVTKNELAAARQAAIREMNLRDAAKVDAGSSASATFDNPTGSNAPFLGLTVETTRSDMGEYLKVLRQLIRGNWRIPNIARYEVSGVTGISFNIHKDGTITDIYVMRPSGHEPLDVSSRNAISNTSPAPPLPKHVDEDKVPIKFGFYYNMRPRY